MNPIISLLFLLTILVLLFGQIWNRKVPKLSGGHAQVGDYPAFNMESCGYLSPKDKLKTNSRIIDGELAEEGEFPWHAAIYVKNQGLRKHICGGALIHKFWVLTAKQCFYPPKESPIEENNLIVSFGSIKIAEIFFSVDVLSIFVHTKENLALLRLKQEVLPHQSPNGNDYRINYACLPKKGIINIYHEDAIISGFGYTQIKNSPPNDRLRKANLLIDPSDDCDKRNFKPLKICGTEAVHMTCFEDLGSPLVQFDDKRAVLIGIVQPAQLWNNQVCGMGVLAFYRVSYFIEWLSDLIKANVTTHSPKISIATSSSPTEMVTNYATTGTVPLEQENKRNFAENLKSKLNIILFLILLSINLLFIQKLQ